ncbi:uncharacterized protein PB18E9.04c-like, partial [Penaeus monodon]|uniref:uncharacterized protein PB18E9.04c-like n=1 Tax=Penaeus monodon TaxID=6687 RepID=UPI0018A76601
MRISFLHTLNHPVSSCSEMKLHSSSRLQLMPGATTPSSASRPLITQGDSNDNPCGLILPKYYPNDPLSPLLRLPLRKTTPLTSISFQYDLPLPKAIPYDLQYPSLSQTTLISSPTNSHYPRLSQTTSLLPYDLPRLKNIPTNPLFTYTTSRYPRISQRPLTPSPPTYPKATPTTSSSLPTTTSHHLSSTTPPRSSKTIPKSQERLILPVIILPRPCAR